jgi:mono/diheme cytochrome c family protein
MPASGSLRTAFAIGVALIAFDAQAASPTPAERGYQRAQLDCAQCHALDAAFDSPNRGAPSFPEVGRRYAEDAVLTARLTAVTRQGHYAMPPRRANARDIQAILAFIRASSDHAWRN